MKPAGVKLNYRCRVLPAWNRSASHGPLCLCGTPCRLLGCSDEGMCSQRWSKVSTMTENDSSPFQVCVLSRATTLQREERKCPASEYSSLRTMLFRGHTPGFSNVLKHTLNQFHLLPCGARSVMASQAAGGEWTIGFHCLNLLNPFPLNSAEMAWSFWKKESQRHLEEEAGDTLSPSLK